MPEIAQYISFLLLFHFLQDSGYAPDPPDATARYSLN